MLQNDDENLNIKNRRQFIHNLMITGGFISLSNHFAFAKQKQFEIQPFENGTRELVTFPQKKPLMLITSRPAHLETPFSVFNKGIITPNDSFFVRYHLPIIPLSVNLKEYRLKISGKVKKPLELSLDQIKKFADPIEIIAVNQCTGNGRGFFSPRVPGAQLGNGSMGNARWVGIPLKKILEAVGVEAGVKQVTFQGLDRPVFPNTPNFIKALNIDHALNGDVLIAWSMNGEDIPVLNGYPLKLIVPGYYSTYWIKHLNEINLIDYEFNEFFMATAYRVPDTPDNGIPPGSTPKGTIPVTNLKVRSFITSLKENENVSTGREITVRGIAFDGGSGIKNVMFSEDAGKTWQETKLSKDYGKYSFREWTIRFTPKSKGIYTLAVRATGQNNLTQAIEPIWNPGGYVRNVIEKINVKSI